MKQGFNQAVSDWYASAIKNTAAEHQRARDYVLNTAREHPELLFEKSQDLLMSNDKSKEGFCAYMMIQMDHQGILAAIDQNMAALFYSRLMKVIMDNQSNHRKTNGAIRQVIILLMLNQHNNSQWLRSIRGKLEVATHSIASVKFTYGAPWESILRNFLNEASRKQQMNDKKIEEIYQFYTQFIKSSKRDEEPLRVALEMCQNLIKFICLKIFSDSRKLQTLIDWLVQISQHVTGNTRNLFIDCYQAFCISKGYDIIFRYIDKFFQGSKVFLDSSNRTLNFWSQVFEQINNKKLPISIRDKINGIISEFVKKVIVNLRRLDVEKQNRQIIAVTTVNIIESILKFNACLTVRNSIRYELNEKFEEHLKPSKIVLSTFILTMNEFSQEGIQWWFNMISKQMATPGTLYNTLATIMSIRLSKYHSVWTRPTMFDRVYQYLMEFLLESTQQLIIEEVNDLLPHFTKETSDANSMQFVKVIFIRRFLKPDSSDKITTSTLKDVAMELIEKMSEQQAVLLLQSIVSYNYVDEFTTAEMEIIGNVAHKLYQKCELSVESALHFTKWCLSLAIKFNAVSFLEVVAMSITKHPIIQHLTSEIVLLCQKVKKCRQSLKLYLALLKIGFKEKQCQQKMLDDVIKQLTKLQNQEKIEIMQVFIENIELLSDSPEKLKRLQRRAIDCYNKTTTNYQKTKDFQEALQMKTIVLVLLRKLLDTMPVDHDQTRENTIFSFVHTLITEMNSTTRGPQQLLIIFDSAKIIYLNQVASQINTADSIWLQKVVQQHLGQMIAQQQTKQNRGIQLALESICMTWFNQYLTSLNSDNR